MSSGQAGLLVVCDAAPECNRHLSVAFRNQYVCMCVCVFFLKVHVMNGTYIKAHIYLL